MLKIKNKKSIGIVTWAAIILLLLTMPAGYFSTSAQRGGNVPVIMISIDGLKPDYVTEAGKHSLRVPNLKRFVTGGAWAAGVTGVSPTVTYPSHTTLVTGVSPAKHGIINNTPLDPFGKNLGGWYWYAEDIKSPALWDVAGKAGLVTASIDWPVTVGANVGFNIVQYWRAVNPDDHKLTRALSTPGLLDQAEKDLGSYPTGYLFDIEADSRRAKFIAWMIEKKRPHLLTAYLSSLDEEQHHTAPYSDTTRRTLERLDALIGEIRSAADRAFGNRYVICVVSDHGHITADRETHLNAALQQAGLIQLDEQKKLKSWKAWAWGAGGSAAIMLNDPSDEQSRNQVRQVLKELAADPQNGIDKMVEGEDARALGGFPGAAFILGLKSGYRTGGSLTGNVVRAGNPGGTHGYLPGYKDMEASFFIAGSTIPSGRNLGTIDMRDIAPTLAAILGVKMPSADGRNLFK